MLGLVMTYIDLVGTYKLGPDQKKRAEKVRMLFDQVRKRGQYMIEVDEASGHLSVWDWV